MSWRPPGSRWTRRRPRRRTLRRAVQWRRYGRGPVDALHRSCAADIAGGRCGCWGHAMTADAVAAADAVVAAIDPGLNSPGVESSDVVLVTGPWLAGVTSLIAGAAAASCRSAPSSSPTSCRPVSAGRGGLRGVGGRSGDRIRLRAGRTRRPLHRRRGRRWWPRSMPTASGATCSPPTASRSPARLPVTGTCRGSARRPHPARRTAARRTRRAAAPAARRPARQRRNRCGRGRAGWRR